MSESDEGPVIDGLVWSGPRLLGLEVVVRHRSARVSNRTDENAGLVFHRVARWLAEHGFADRDRIGGVEYLVANARTRTAAEAVL